MVDLAHVARASALADERGQIVRALAMFDAGGTIWTMSVGVESSGSDLPPNLSNVVLVNTREWTYPPQMLSSIKEQLQVRLAEIDKELSDMGVTGVAS